MPGQIADLQHHLDVEPRAGVQPLGLEQLALVLEHFEPLFQLLLDRVDGRGDPLLGHHEVLGRIDEQLLLAGESPRRWSGLMIESCSTSSPQNSIRRANSSYDGQSSTQSPRTRNLPRANSTSLRSYCMSTSFVSSCVAVDRHAALAGRSSSPCNPRANPSRRCTTRWPR